MRKILIIYKFLPEYRVDFYNHLKNKLLENDIELNLVYGKFNKVDALRANEVDIEWAKYVPNKRLKIGSKELIWQSCLKLIKGNEMIIIQQENRLLLNYYLMLRRRVSRLKLAMWGHVSNMQDDPNSFSNQFKLYFMRKCDWWFGYTNSARDFLIKNGYPLDHITVVQNAIDTLSLRRHYAQIPDSEREKLKKELGIMSENVGIYCSGMYADKDVGYVLQLCKLIKEKVPDFHMLFVGSGSDAHKVKEAAERDPWIHYVGPKFGEERVVYFTISAIQIMPRLVGLSILDSFAMETPLVTTDHPFHGPEIDYLENGLNGIMTKDDVSVYTEAVANLLKTRGFVQLAEAGKLASEKYTVENMAENFRNGILSALKGKG